MRLIDADALIVEIKTCLWDWESVNGIESKTVLNQTITDIENMPTIDAVPVIRCKDCKIRYTDRCGMFDVEAEWEWTEDNGFCQYGERKES